MKIGKRLKTPIFTGDNLDEIMQKIPFYITRDDQIGEDDNSPYSIKNAKGKPRICYGQDKETKGIHFFTNIGILKLNVGEHLEFMEIE